MNTIFSENDVNQYTPCSRTVSTASLRSQLKCEVYDVQSRWKWGGESMGLSTRVKWNNVIIFSHRGGWIESINNEEVWLRMNKILEHFVTEKNYKLIENYYSEKCVLHLRCSSSNPQRKAWIKYRIFLRSRANKTITWNLMEKNTKSKNKFTAVACSVVSSLFEGNLERRTPCLHD